MCYGKSSFIYRFRKKKRRLSVVRSELPATRCVGGVLYCQMGISSMRRLGRDQHNPALFPSMQHLRRKNRGIDRK